LPDACTKDGQALYRLQDIAQRFGITEEEALEAALEMGVALLEGDADVQPLH